MRVDQDARIGTSDKGVYYGPKTKQAATRRVEKRNGLSHTNTIRYANRFQNVCVVGTAKKRLMFLAHFGQKTHTFSGSKTKNKCVSGSSPTQKQTRVSKKTNNV